jgi:hypothetical protein
MPNQMGEDIFIRHQRDRRSEKRSIHLCPGEDATRTHAKQAVWKEMPVHVDAKRPRIASKRASRAGTHGRFETQRVQREGQSLEVRATYQKVDVDEIPPPPQSRPPAQQEHALQWHHHDAALATCLKDLIR